MISESPSLASETTPTADELREALDVARGLRISPRAYRLIEWLFDNIPALLADRDRVDWLGKNPRKVHPPNACVGFWTVQGSEDKKTLREAIDAARLRPERPEGAE